MENSFTPKAGRTEDDDLDDEGPETEEFVERGVFRVDPVVAAQKLRDYQLPDANAFLIPWFRAAASFGARRVEAHALGDGLEFSFDGAAPDPAVLKELTAGLLNADYGEPARQLAYGALAVQRLKPSALSAIRVGDRTVITICWEGGVLRAAKALKLLRSAYGMSRVKLIIEGSEVPDPAQGGAPAKAWTTQSTEVIVLDDPGARDSGRLRFFKFGMLVEESIFNLGGFYTAYVANNRFTLSLSQSSVVHDKRFERSVRRLERLRRRLVLRDSPRGTMIRVWARRSLIAAGVVGVGALGLWRLWASGLLP